MDEKLFFLSLFSKQHTATYATKLIIGQNIKVGQTIGYISTVGIKTSVKSNVAGSIEQILLKNGEVADYGKKLIKVKKIVD